MLRLPLVSRRRVCDVGGTPSQPQWYWVSLRVVGCGREREELLERAETPVAIGLGELHAQVAQVQGSSLAAILQAQCDMDTAFQTGGSEASDNARRNENKGNFDGARFASQR